MLTVARRLLLSRRSNVAPGSSLRPLSLNIWTPLNIFTPPPVQHRPLSGKPTFRINQELRDLQNAGNRWRQSAKFIEVVNTAARNNSKLNMYTMSSLMNKVGKFKLSLTSHMKPGVVEWLIGQIPNTQRFGSQAVGSVIYGLQRTEGSHEMDFLLRALTVKVTQSTEELNGQAVGNALYGLQGMGSNDAVDGLLRALTVKVAQCKQELKGQHVGNALYGLQGMGSNDAVDSLLRALTVKVTQSKQELKGQAVGNALYGLQGMSETADVVDLLNVLLPLVRRCDDMLCTHLSQALYGVHHLEAATQLKATLLDKLRELPSQNLDQSSHAADLMSTLQLMGNEDSTLVPPHIVAKADSHALSIEGVPQSLFERRVQSFIGTCGLNTPVLFNVFHHGFEMDVFLPEEKLNLELDGPHHSKVVQKRRDERRDRYLEARHGVCVRRITHTDWQLLKQDSDSQRLTAMLLQRCDDDNADVN